VPKEKPGAVPVPERATVWGLFAALSEIVRVACLVPEAVGVKVTKIAQFAMDPSVEGQLLVSAKSPVTCTAVIDRGDAPVFVNVTDWSGVVAPTVCEPNAKEVVVRVTVAAEGMIVKLRGDERPPPGAGLDTAINAAPG